MEADEKQIRELIERWAAAVHRGELDAVLADHAGDIVTFDVPPPERGVRGIDAYRETWPPFFRWQASGAVFELDELEVAAGGGAYAFALLRCGRRGAPRTPRPATAPHPRPAPRGGRWIVAQEHHSFADDSTG